ncbi:MAG: InlB B-repeat-containing protein, partial [Clostridia bacterium]|nr:InlB B-repeat-containing protein [Clostridia bacterium]
MKRVLKTIPIAPLKVLFVLTLAFAILIGTTVLSATTDVVANAADATKTTKTYLAYELAKSTKATSDGLLTVDRDRAMADDYEKDIAWDFSYVSTQKTLTFTFTPDGGNDVAFYEVTVPKMIATESSTRLTVTVTCGSKSVTGTLVDGTGDNEGTCSMNSFSIPGLSTNPVVANKVTVTVTRISGEFRTIFSESFKFVYGPAPVPVSISAGTGVKSVYLSTSSTATSGSASGTNYSSGTTVYGFAELAKGYKAKSGWTKVSGTADTEGAKYRIGSKTVSSAQDFGTVSADLITYSIGYTLNGGTVSGTNPTSYNVTTNTFTLKNPTKTGYTFTGWTGSNGSTPQKSVSISKGTIGNKTYTANWTVNQYNITYKDGGDKAFSGAHEDGYPTTHTYGTETALKSASKTGYTFSGWYTDSNCTGAAVTSLGATAYTADITLYAKWTSNSYAVTLDDNGSSGGQGSVTATFDSYIEPLAQLPTKTGYTFAGYYDAQNEPGAASPSGTRYISETGSSTKVWDKASDTTLYAYYTKDMTVSATGYEADYDAGAHTITVTVTDPANGYFILYYDTEKSVNTSDNPQKTNVGSYTVEFYVNKDGYTQYHGSATIVINEVDKTYLTSPLESVDAYYDLIKDKYTTIANTLKDVIDNVKNNIRDNANVTAEQVAQAVADLQTALSTAKVDVTEAKIDAIGSGYYSSEKASAIQDARNYYDDELTDGEKAAVSNYQKLLDAEALYGPVGEVVTEINALGEITDPQVLKTSIETARDHYNALNQDQKDVFPVEILKVLTDNEAIIEVVDEINALGAPENTDAFRGAVTSARGSYNSLTNEQKDIFPAAVLKLLTDDEAAIDVMDLINAISTVEYTDACKGKIDTANTAYDLLDDAQKTLVANYGVLEQANTDYNKVDEVHDLITLLDPFEYSEDYADALDNARNAYNALTSFQKSILPAEDLKELVDDEKAFDAMAKIDAIGTVTATDVCKDGIDTARGAYNALTDDQKARVGNYEYLTDAEAAYAVAVKIDAIDKIVTLDSKDGIDEARGAYNELTDDQKARVGNYGYLTDAEAALAVVDLIAGIDEVIL